MPTVDSKKIEKNAPAETPEEKAKREERAKNGIKWKNVELHEGKWRYHFVGKFQDPEPTDPDYIDFRLSVCFRDIRIADALADGGIDRVFHLAASLTGTPPDVLDRASYDDARLIIQVVEEISAKNSSAALRFMEGAERESKT